MLPVYIGAGISVTLLVVLLALKLRKKDAKKGKSRDAEIVKDISYAQTNETKLGEVVVDEIQGPYEKDDILIPAKVEMKVGKGKNILPGKYIISSTDENRLDLNIKIGGYVRVYSHGSEVILAEGDTIMPIAIGIILR